MLRRIGLFSLLLVFVLVSGFGCKTSTAQQQANTKQVTLVYWRTFDDSEDFSDSIAKYEAIHPNIKIDYHKFRYEEYENELLNAWAEDRGPDIFSIHNTWIGKYQSKIVAMPAQTTLTYLVETGTIKKEIVPQVKTVKSLTVKDLKANFADVVAGDVVLDDGLIYGLPLSVDTLALYYNRDLLNSAGIIDVPKYWNKDFQQDIKKLSKQDTQKGIVQSGIALGTADNIERYSDILSVLMMQNGAVMQNGNQILFNANTNTDSNNYNPGAEALRFYTDFANPQKEVYSWNNKLSNNLEAFASGRLAMFLGYSYHLEQIRAKAPTLNFSIAKLPQIEGNTLQVNFANYWVETVSKKSKNSNEAWDFLQFITKEENVKKYLEKTQKPTALKSLISSQKDSEDLGVFAEQILSAKSWYRGRSAYDAERALQELINNALIAPDKIKELINSAVSKVQQTIN